MSLPVPPSGTSFTTPRPSGPAPLPAPIGPGRLLHEETVPGGAGLSFVVRRHQTLRLTSLEAGANVSFLCFNRAEPVDRYNMADTLKGQHTARLTTGFMLYSDMGRALFSITGDTLGWHDPLGGHDTVAHVERKWGVKNFQTARNGFHRNSRDHFLIELGKHGLNARDLVPNVNFFSKLSTDTEGRLAYVAGHSRAGDHLDLRAELDALVVLTTCHHPMDPRPAYGPAPVLLQIHATPPPAADDYCRTYRPENARALYNSELFSL